MILVPFKQGRNNFPLETSIEYQPRDEKQIGNSLLFFFFFFPLFLFFFFFFKILKLSDYNGKNRSYSPFPPFFRKYVQVKSFFSGLDTCCEFCTVFKIAILDF